MPSAAEKKATPAGRAAAGKAARRDAPRSAHGEWAAASDRPDPVALLEAQAASRVGQLVPLRYGRMLASPFAFYRGAAAVMAADLAPTPRSGFTAQLCGDAHLSNFGGFASPERTLLFDLNDFDETLPGPWEWDLKRLAASFAVAGRERSFDRRRRRLAIDALAAAYRNSMRHLAGMGNLEVWYQQLDVEGIAARWLSAVSDKQVRAFERNLAKVRAKDSSRAFAKLTREVDGRPRIVSEPPLLIPFDELTDADGGDLEARVQEVLDAYRETLDADRRVLFDGYSYADAALKVVGVGSVGTRAWIVLLLGRDERDPLFLQVKEAQRSVLEPYASPSVYTNQGERVVQGQRLLQAASDIMLGWVSASVDEQEHQFYVRQLWDAKGSAQIERMDPRAMAAYAEICGTTLARAHARGGDRIAIAAYLGKGTTFDDALSDFAEAYADQNERDYDALREAAAAGRIEVAADPKAAAK